MATEALDLPRDATITVRLPHRVRVLLRALRIAHGGRTEKLSRELANHDVRIRADVGITRRRPSFGTWIEVLLAQGQGHN